MDKTRINHPIRLYGNVIIWNFNVLINNNNDSIIKNRFKVEDSAKRYYKSSLPRYFLFDCYLLCGDLNMTTKL